METKFTIKLTRYFYGPRSETLYMDQEFSTVEEAQAVIDEYENSPYRLESGECSRPRYRIVKKINSPASG